MIKAAMCESETNAFVNTGRRGEVWFVAQLKPNCLPIAERNLQRQGFRTFMPGCHTSAYGKTAQVQPLFPGYLFVAVDVLAGQWRAINSTYGVTRLVSFGGRPSEVSACLISELQRRVAASDTLQCPPQVRPGDDVSLSSGPFADFVAKVESLAPEQRVWLLLDLMGRQTRVTARLADLRAGLARG